MISLVVNSTFIVDVVFVCTTRAARVVLFSAVFVCVFFCLFVVCQHDNNKTVHEIFMASAYGQKGRQI